MKKYTIVLENTIKIPTTFVLPFVSVWQAYKWAKSFIMDSDFIYIVLIEENI